MSSDYTLLKASLGTVGGVSGLFILLCCCLVYCGIRKRDREEARRWRLREERRQHPAAARGYTFDLQLRTDIVSFTNPMTVEHIDGNSVPNSRQQDTLNVARASRHRRYSPTPSPDVGNTITTHPERFSRTPPPSYFEAIKLHSPHTSHSTTVQ